MDDCQRLTDTVERFSQFIDGFPASALMEQDWGPREVLAHLVYHHEVYVMLVVGLLSGQPVAPPQGRFSDLNAAAVAASRGIPTPELVARLRQANQRLVQLYREHDPAAIIVEIKAGAKPRTLAKLLPEAEAHIRNHLQKLRRAAKAADRQQRTGR